jgi:two-component system, OmpR family, phosphate regulon response regulator PhoB
MARILVVDDDPAMRRLLKLTVGAEHQLEEAADGGQALRLLRATEPDIVLLDVIMPGAMDGLEVCRAARADPALGHVGIIVVSGYAAREESLAAGADCYFTKPWRPLELLTSIDALLARRPGDRPDISDEIVRFTSWADPHDVKY